MTTPRVVRRRLEYEDRRVTDKPGPRETVIPESWLARKRRHAQERKFSSDAAAAQCDTPGRTAETGEKHVPRHGHEAPADSRLRPGPLLRWAKFETGRFHTNCRASAGRPAAPHLSSEKCSGTSAFSSG
ncbi:hypothetical protein PCL_05860 [Purpureocillium lilacinum]|uniref:Uncharacterized protein n=1 Tax=Purpureocillium lilacinum TaxID=33203 RepID=A0A2U3EL46_PURLI|nr:hypothetical protein Purlil1_5925 [Purpureocillium lilacinum]PWI75202.1 hypothetical protein PCL_05860 [Purpureocillium lilacinum]